MAYFSASDIQQYTGFASTDFKINGVTMNATQWATFCSWIVDTVTQTVNRYCNIDSFEYHAATEYKNGKGASDKDNDDYIEEDRLFRLTLPCVSVASVYEDVSSKTATPSWTIRYARSAATAGDYEVATERELTWIRFHQNVPKEGQRNVEIIYYAGWPTSDVRFNELNLICCRIAANILVNKKKIQEAMTIRNTGIRDYAEMFKPVDEYKVLTEDIRVDLSKYRRFVMGGLAWD